MKLKTDLNVAVDVGEQLDKPKAKVDLDFLLASTKLEGPLDLPPIRLEAKSEAGADLLSDDARLGKLSASFNGEELLSLRADLKGLETQDFVLYLDKPDCRLRRLRRMPVPCWSKAVVGVGRRSRAGELRHQGKCAETGRNGFA